VAERVNDAGRRRSTYASAGLHVGDAGQHMNNDQGSSACLQLNGATLFSELEQSAMQLSSYGRTTATRKPMWS
jgi:hypothetical protein